MSKSPLWFTLLAAIALLWNLAGLFAVVTDLCLSAADIAALSVEQQALYAARPMWSVLASIIAVVGGTLGCLALLLHKRWSFALFCLSFVGVVLQDIGIFLVAGAAKSDNPVPFVLQGLVLVISLGLIALARRGITRMWLA